MARFIEMLEHPSELVSHRSARRLARRASETVHQRPGSILGIIALVAVVVGFIYMFPELRRYLRMERM